MKYIPIVETLSDLLSLSSSQVKLDNKEFQDNIDLFKTDSKFVFDDEVKTEYYYINKTFDYWHGFHLYKFNKGEYLIYSNDEYVRLI